MTFRAALDAAFDAQLAAFGVDVRYAPKGRTAYGTLTAIFDRQFVDVTGLSEVGVASTGPRLMIRAADINLISRGDTVRAEGETFEVVEIEPDGQGAANVKLKAFE